ncbi:hypothetical protein P8452_74073 [Trifolium repens]|nr:hypothetical protein P8452_74073 [Trifolium repens]
MCGTFDDGSRDKFSKTIESLKVFTVVGGGKGGCRTEQPKPNYTQPNLVNLTNRTKFQKEKHSLVSHIASQTRIFSVHSQVCFKHFLLSYPVEINN